MSGVYLSLYGTWSWSEVRWGDDESEPFRNLWTNTPLLSFLPPRRSVLELPNNSEVQQHILPPRQWVLGYQLPNSTPILHSLVIFLEGGCLSHNLVALRLAAPSKGGLSHFTAYQHNDTPWRWLPITQSSSTPASSSLQAYYTSQLTSTMILLEGGCLSHSLIALLLAAPSRLTTLHSLSAALPKYTLCQQLFSGVAYHTSQPTSSTS